MVSVMQYTLEYNTIYYSHVLYLQRF